MTNLFFKQSPWSHLVAAGTFALLFAACGDEITEVTEVVGMQVVEAGDALPKCTADNEGAMVYSVDSAAAYTCIGKKWTSMKGKDGKDGADGKDGKDGADGKNGKDGKNGTNGTNGTNGSSGKSCSAVAIDNGYKIVCGGDSVGVVLNGEDGQDGAKGDTGVAGTSCSAEEDSAGVKITCTDGKSFTLSNGTDGSDGKNCEIARDTNGVITLTCGEDTTMLYKAMCGTKPYDPAKQLCDFRDMQLYRVVTIGEQTWMAENLNYKIDSSWCGGGSSKNEGDCTKYGRLYTWAAAIDSAKLYKDRALDCGYDKTCSLPDTVYGICPSGWHLPYNREWNKLFTAVGGNRTAGKKLKSQTGWNDYNGTSGNGTDAYGFSAFPAGYRSSGGYFNGGDNAQFWSATESNGANAYSMYLSITREDADLYNIEKNGAFSVRCLKD